MLSRSRAHVGAVGFVCDEETVWKAWLGGKMHLTGTKVLQSEVRGILVLAPRKKKNGFIGGDAHPDSRDGKHEKCVSHN